MKPLAGDHGAVPDGGEALGGAQHQGVLHPHTGQHLGSKTGYIILENGK